MPRRPCLEADCTALAQPGKPRCYRCQRIKDAAKWQKNPNRDRTYRHLKADVIQRLPLPCALCGDPITHSGHGADALTFDHIRPWSVGGSNDPSNLRLAHKRCNSSRGTRL